MTKNQKRGFIAVLVIVVVLVIDQALKIWVKTHMELGRSISITSWFTIYFVENNGMAFGMEVIRKLFLTLFRIIAVVVIAIYLTKIVKKEYSSGFIVCIALVLAGAFGNIIDCVFYGKIFTASHFESVAHFASWGQGYASWMKGQVVDMLYFPLIKGNFPLWFPGVGGQHFVFFSPIFNIADSAITVGVILLLVFFRKTLSYSLDRGKHSKAN